MLRTFLTLLLLIVMSALCAGLMVTRHTYYQQPFPYYLAWNLFLAWIPLGIALIVRITRLHLILALPFIAGWLLFFPNAPYILTDLIHLRHAVQKGIWLDLVLILSTGITALFVGYVSLAWMQATVRSYLGTALSWFFALTAIALGGVGVYIGRFLRWNSWDVFFNPRLLAHNLLAQLDTPWNMMHMATMSAIFAAIIFFPYLMTLILPQESAETI